MPDEIAQLRAELAQEGAQRRAAEARLEAMFETMHAAINSVTEATTRKPSVEPSREIGTMQLKEILPPGMRGRASIYRGLKSGRIPGRKIGNRWACEPEKVHQHIDRSSGIVAVQQYLAACKAAKKQKRAGRRRQPLAGAAPDATSSHSQAGTTSTAMPSTDSASR